ncbi:hypothetical protein P3T76_004722 [Phytophthora citrophthora]|uniref:RxLR effector protein n=1 Tax=Phytophthora citrophthora TaxID=4793 RepID=A0AAD9LP85_9STRA|nr:hypothetical protein P3T76_004722 [Phytophthora citrophthora]
MRLPYIVLATVVTFLVTLDASSIVQATDGKLSSGRSLRIATDTGLEQDEERGIITTIRTAFSKKAKVDAWAKADKSDDFVRKALKMENVADDQLWAMKNYPLYQRFAEKAEAKKINDWLIGDVPTYSAWVKLGLGSYDDIEKVKSTAGFKTYEKFVNQYDDQVLNLLKDYGVAVPVAKATSPTEMNARMDILAAANRGDDYAKQVLGLDKLKGVELTSHTNYRYFKHYKRVVKDLKAGDKKLNRLPTITER